MKDRGSAPMAASSSTLRCSSSARPARRAAAVLALGLAALPAAAQAKPQRIVSLNVCAGQVLIDLVAPARIRSVTFLAADPAYSNVAKRAAKLRLNRGRAEEVIPLDPDLVLAGRYTATATVELLRRVGKNVVVIPLARDIPGIRRAIRAVARAVGEGAKGEAMIARFDARLASARPAGPARPVIALYWPRGYTGGIGGLSDAVVRYAGFRNLVRVGGIQRDGLLPLEKLATSGVDALVLPRTGGAPSLATAMLAHPVFRHVVERTPHVRIDSRLWDCGTAYVAEAIEDLAALRKRILAKPGQ